MFENPWFVTAVVVLFAYVLMAVLPSLTHIRKEHRHVDHRKGGPITSGD
jgi:hypothetical protein